MFLCCPSSSAELTAALEASKYAGVSPLPYGKFAAEVREGGKTRQLGTFNTAQQAAAAW